MKRKLISFLTAFFLFQFGMGSARAAWHSYNLTAWSSRDGAPTMIRTLAQTIDGYLWIGGGTGLYRFDGYRFEQVQPPIDEPQINDVTAIAPLPSGGLWITLFNGNCILLRHGHARLFPWPHQGWTVAPDPDGSLWLGTATGLAQFKDDRFQMLGATDGLPPAKHIDDVLVGDDRTVWALIGSELFWKQPGANVFRSTGLHFNGRNGGLTIGADGGPWVLDPAGGARQVERRANGSFAMGALRNRQISRIVSDRSAPPDRSKVGFATYDTDHIGQAIAVVTDFDAGAMQPGRWFLRRQPGIDALPTPEWLDRDGNIWLGLRWGLVRLRRANFRMLDFGRALISSSSGRASDGRGGHYFSSIVSVARSGKPGADLVLRHFRPMGKPGSDLADASRRYPFPADAIPATGFAGILPPTADGLTMWATSGIWTLKDGTISTVPLPLLHGRLHGLARDASGQLWTGLSRGGVLVRRDGQWHRKSDIPDLFKHDPAEARQDDLGRIFIDSPVHPNTLLMIDRGEQHFFEEKHGLAIGNLTTIKAIGDDDILTGSRGIARIRRGEVRTLPLERLGGLTDVSGIAQGPNGDVWLNSLQGAARIKEADWARAFDSPARSLRFALFDERNGLLGGAEYENFDPSIITIGNELWFLTSEGIGSVDPRHIFQNSTPSIPRVLSIFAEGRRYAPAPGVELPKGSSNFEIDFGARDLTAPERVRFFYKLAGVDSDWVAAGQRQQAFYTHIGPGSYRFHLRAENESGVPSAEIAPVNIMIPPTFVQSATFRIIIAITVLTLMILGLALWHRGLTRRLRTQIEERLRERERVARDLHDTLLQGFQGIVLRFQALAMGIAPQTGVPERINTILCDADGVMAEARSQVRDLRGGNGATDLTARFAAIAGERVTDIPVSIHTEGRVRELHPIVRNEIFRIGREATLNAISHSAASEILITLVYRSSFFAVDVSDDGIGIDHRLMTHGRDGHFGLATMRERAKQIGADLELTSPPGRGTHLTLRIPARIAYRRPPLLAIAWPWNRRASDAA